VGHIGGSCFAKREVGKWEETKLFAVLILEENIRVNLTEIAIIRIWTR
jgi:hypothetical protein